MGNASKTAGIRGIKVVSTRGAGGYLRLVAWATRASFLEAEHCADASNEAIHPFGPPFIMNTGKGDRITSLVWIDRLRRSYERI